MEDLGLSMVTLPMQCDNQVANTIALNHIFYEGIKHIEYDCCFIQEKISGGLTCTSYVKSENQLAKLFA